MCNTLISGGKHGKQPNSYSNGYNSSTHILWLQAWEYNRGQEFAASVRRVSKYFEKPLQT